MKKSAPGFTLIELLVVIVIIAILASIGMVVYGGIQRQARDSKREADINAVANVMESNYDSSTQAYRALDSSYFSGGVVPKDPLDGDTSNSCNGSPCKYCFKDATSSACLSSDASVDAGQPTFPPRTSYYACANLETAGAGQAGTNYYCRSNQQ
ncbi:MAG: type II secretion system GspH family protein [Patescibacteria group bacterium]|nr:type II secretion system GspH family protein [Patescibacteria group bacterium]